MSNLYQDAILDAKALRASAIANAKAALEEAFEPKIQEMLRAKLSEEEVKEIEEAEEIKEEAYEDGMEEGVTVEETADITNEELDSILAELEKLEQVEEAKHSDAEHDKLEEAKDEEEEEEEETEEGEEEGEEEVGEEEVEAPEADGEAADDKTKVVNITLGDLKRVIMNAYQQMMGAQADLGMPAEEPTEEPTADSEAEADVPLDEISLDEILDELEAEGMENAPHRDPGHSDGHDTPIYPELEEKKEKYKDAKKVEKELEEAKATIDAMRKDLQEVNLLNAKYLYMNKLFKSKSLTESQKVKVINALDRATTVNEVKNAYETLRESFETKKQTIKESIGFASKPAGVAPKANIVEADQFISRWQKLAGIKK